jgi:hypothetical protein
MSLLVNSLKLDYGKVIRFSQDTGGNKSSLKLPPAKGEDDHPVGSEDLHKGSNFGLLDKSFSLLTAAELTNPNRKICN